MSGDNAIVRSVRVLRSKGVYRFLLFCGYAVIWMWLYAIGVLVGSGQSSISSGQIGFPGNVIFIITFLVGVASTFIVWGAMWLHWLLRPDPQSWHPERFAVLLFLLWLGALIYLFAWYAPDARAPHVELAKIPEVDSRGAW